MGTEINSPAVDTATWELASMVEATFIGALAGKNRRIADGLEVKLAKLRAELQGPDPSPALRIATESAVLCWLDRWTVELIASNDPARISPALDRRRNWAARRLNQALTTCERIAYLTRPRGPRYAIQINQTGAVGPPAYDLALAQ